jgi:hypothetical protein
LPVPEQSFVQEPGSGETLLEWAVHGLSEFGAGTEGTRARSGAKAGAGSALLARAEAGFLMTK